MIGKERKDLEAAMGITLKKILDETKAVGFSGRCWGTKGSLCEGSHVTLGEREGMVSIFVKDGGICIAEYRKTSGTALGKKVQAILKVKNLPLAE